MDAEMKDAARKLGLNLGSCLEFGVRFKAAEINDSEYPSNLLSHKIESMAERLKEAMRRIEELEAQKIGDKNRAEQLPCKIQGDVR